MPGIPAPQLREERRRRKTRERTKMRRKTMTSRNHELQLDETLSVCVRERGGCLCFREGKRSRVILFLK